MTPEQTTNVIRILTKLLEKYDSMRSFSREIREDVSDVSRWKMGKKCLTPRAIISICRLYPDIPPYFLNPDLFPEDLLFNFKRSK